MELGSSRLIGGVPRTEGVKNGVRSDVYEGKREKKNVKNKRRKEKEKKEKEREGRRRKKKEEKEKERGFSRSEWE